MFFAARAESSARWAWGWVLCALGCAATSSAAPGDSGGEDEFTPNADAPHVRFEPEAGPMAFGAIPWPDDLYLDASGHIALDELPGDERRGSLYGRPVRESLGELSGFGGTTPAYFYFDKDIDERSLPGAECRSASARCLDRASTGEDASVFLMHVDASSPGSLRRVPVRVHWLQRERRLAVLPARGHPLSPGGQYAAVVTRDVLGKDGVPAEPSETYARVLYAQTSPGDAVLARAHALHLPVINGLEASGIDRDQVAQLAVFRVQRVQTMLEEARAIVRDPDAPEPRAEIADVLSGAELDGALGTVEAGTVGFGDDGAAPHSNIGWMIHGTFDAPSFLNALDGGHGHFQRDEPSGELLVKGRSSVPFSLWLPALRGETELGTLPVLIFQHGLGAERSDALGIADRLVAAGYAVLAIDAPFHGLRSPELLNDTFNRFTGALGADGFGDVASNTVFGDAVGLAPRNGSLPALHPAYFRDMVRQTVVDVMLAVRLLQEGDWSELRARDEALANLAFEPHDIGFIGVGFGGQVGIMLGTLEPDVGALLLGMTGGHWTANVSESPEFRTVFRWLKDALNRERTVDYEREPPLVWPELSIWQTLFGAGDGSSYTPLLRAKPVNVFMLSARHDERVSNHATEALARALGAGMVEGQARFTSIESLGAPVSGNFTARGQLVTRALAEFHPATHEMLFRSTGVRNYETPLVPPFEELADPVTVQNPTEDVQTRVSFFFESWRQGAAVVIGGGDGPG